MHINHKDYQMRYNLIKNELEVFNKEYFNNLKSGIFTIDTILKYLNNRKGKQLRPSLCLIVAKSLNNINNKTYTVASLVEMIHVATLMHDDVVDESEFRRGKLSPNEVWGNKTSVLVGDFLFSRAFQLMAKDKSEKVLKLLSDTSVIISEGEILELSNDKDPTIGENIYFKVIKGKTASLFSAACQVGGIIANLEKDKEEALKTFGENFGIGFQLIDDALDYSSSIKNLGKNKGDDFKEGKITMPIILSYLRSNESEKNFWNRTVKNLDQQPKDFEYAVQLINKYNCIEDTILRAKHFTNIAQDSLGIFQNNKYKFALLDLVKTSLNRLS